MRRDYEDDEDDDRPRRKKRRGDDEDDRPRRRRRPAPKSKSSTGLILGLVGGGVAVVLLIGGGVVAYMVMNKPSANANRPVVAGGPVVPSGPMLLNRPNDPNVKTVWHDFRQPNGLYSVKIPLDARFPVVPPLNELKPFGEDQTCTLLSSGPECGVIISVKILSPRSLEHQVLSEKHEAAVPPAFVTRRQVSWLGRTVFEDTSPDDGSAPVKRHFRDGNRVYEFEFRGNFRKPSEADQSKFFDSVVIDPR